jgi:hypothetical protein
MTQSPKEYAIELIDKYYHGVNLIAISEKEAAYKAAKECAAIALNEIIIELKGFDNMDGYSGSRIEYYQEVLQEIQNIK